MQRGFYTIAEALFSGSCLLGMILLPGISSFITPTSVVPIPIDFNATTIQFTLPSGYGYSTIQNKDIVLFNTLVMYSEKALQVSQMFQILGSITLLFRIQNMVRNYKQYQIFEQRNTARMVISVMAFLSCLVAFVMLVLIIHIDLQLYLSQTNVGYFGTPNWFYNSVNLRSAANMEMIMQWQTFNGGRNICGVISYILSQFSQIPNKELSKDTRAVAGPINASQYNI